MTLARHPARPPLATFALAAGVALFVAPLPGCDVSVDGRAQARGSGVVSTERRSVPAFSAIQVENGIQVVATVGEPTSVSVSADDNLLPLVRTGVVDGTLHLETTR